MTKEITLDELIEKLLNFNFYSQAVWMGFKRAQAGSCLNQSLSALATDLSCMGHPSCAQASSLA